MRAVNIERKVGSKCILGPVSFELHHGQGLAIEGPNGSGKTTLLRILIGRDEPTSGSLTFDDVIGPGSYGVASVTGAPPFYEDLTIEDHLKLIQTSWGGEPVTGAYEPILESLNMTRILHQFPDELSSGERQMAGLSFALLRPASVIFLDEPEQRLDRWRRSALGNLLLERKNSGTAIVMASHDQELVDKVTDTSIRLEDRT